MKILSDAIEAEEAKQKKPERIIPPGHVEFVLSEAQYRRAQAASQMAGYSHFADFCRVAIENEADRIIAEEAKKKK